MLPPSTACRRAPSAAALHALEAEILAAFAHVSAAAASAARALTRSFSCTALRPICNRSNSALLSSAASRPSASPRRLYGLSAVIAAVCASTVVAPTAGECRAAIASAADAYKAAVASAGLGAGEFELPGMNIVFMLLCRSAAGLPGAYNVQDRPCIATARNRCTPPSPVCAGRYSRRPVSRCGQFHVHGAWGSLQEASQPLRTRHCSQMSSLFIVHL